MEAMSRVWQWRSKARLQHEYSKLVFLDSTSFSELLDHIFRTSFFSLIYLPQTAPDICLTIDQHNKLYRKSASHTYLSQILFSSFPSSYPQP